MYQHIDKYSKIKKQLTVSFVNGWLIQVNQTKFLNSLTYELG